MGQFVTADASGETFFHIAISKIQGLRPCGSKPPSVLVVVRTLHTNGEYMHVVGQCSVKKDDLTSPLISSLNVWNDRHYLKPASNLGQYETARSCPDTSVASALAHMSSALFFDLSPRAHGQCSPCRARTHAPTTAPRPKLRSSRPVVVPRGRSSCAACTRWSRLLASVAKAARAPTAAPRAKPARPSP
jgi:hypothetical protein